MTTPPAEIERFRRARQDRGLVVVEGLHALKHAVRFGAEILAVATLDPGPAGNLAREVAPDLIETLRSALSVGRDAFASLSPQPHPTGVIALARRPAIDVASALAQRQGAPFVVLEEPARLGNLGAAIRVAAAAGAAGVLTIGAQDPWCPEAIRGGAGLQFALPVAAVERLAASTRPLVAVTPDGIDLNRVSIPTGAFLAFGHERHGLSTALRQRASLEVRIPMREGVSSLNLATAVAVMLYRWRLHGAPGAVLRGDAQ